MGDIEVKETLARAITEFLAPIRERRASYQAQPELIEEILHSGNHRMHLESEETMHLVREAMGMRKAEARPGRVRGTPCSPGLIYC